MCLKKAHIYVFTSWIWHVLSKKKIQPFFWALSIIVNLNAKKRLKIIWSNSHIYVFTSWIWTRLSPHTSIGTRVKRIPIISSYRSKSQLSLEQKINIFNQKLKKIQLFEFWVKFAFLSWKINFWKKSRKYPKNVTNSHGW